MRTSEAIEKSSGPLRGPWYCRLCGAIVHPTQRCGRYGCPNYTREPAMTEAEYRRKYGVRREVSVEGVIHFVRTPLEGWPDTGDET